MYSRGIEKVRKPSVYAGFRTFNIYSSSMVPTVIIMFFSLFCLNLSYKSTAIRAGHHVHNICGVKMGSSLCIVKNEFSCCIRRLFVIFINIESSFILASSFKATHRNLCYLQIPVRRYMSSAKNGAFMLR